MALPGTHLRAAFELKEKLLISDEKKYFSGTVYPDSRYVSGLAREFTHSEDQIKPSFYQEDDFKKGWFVHLIYDETQKTPFADTLGFLFENLDSGIIHASKDWITLTAIKTLQDIFDIHAFPIDRYLKNLEYMELPNQENPELIKKYNLGIIEMYNNLPNKPEDYRERFAFLGIEPELVKKIIVRADELSDDAKVVSLIKKQFTETMSLIYDRYPTF